MAEPRQRSRAAQLRPLLDALRLSAEADRRIDRDPVSLVRRYAEVADQEVAGLLCASLAYGRVDLFRPILARLLTAMAPSPARFCDQLAQATTAAAAELAPFRGLVYRFHTGADLAGLALAIGEARAAFGSLEGLFLAQLAAQRPAEPRPAHPDLRAALAGFADWLRTRATTKVWAALGPPRALDHLLPDARRPGASKRLLLFLRWMVRGPDAVDLGAWRRISPARLSIPVDTHIARMARNLGLTRRRDLSWRTSAEITERLRQLAPDDPVRYDFALCHFGMSGACPARRRASHCGGCPLLGQCRSGQRLLRLPARDPTRTDPRLAAGARER